MPNFHLDKNGNPAGCTATKRPCPLGGKHYENFEDAYEGSMDRATSRTAQLKHEVEVWDSGFDNWQKEYGTTDPAAEENSKQFDYLKQVVGEEFAQAHPSKASREQAVAAMTPEKIIANAHRIYDYLEENGLDADSVDREAAFSHAADHSGVDYEELYNAWLEKLPVGDPHLVKVSEYWDARYTRLAELKDVGMEHSEAWARTESEFGLKPEKRS